MTSKKISELDAVSAIDGTEKLAVVKGSTTQRATVSEAVTSWNATITGTWTFSNEITVNSVSSSDWARKSAANTFTAPQTFQGASQSNVYWDVTNAAADTGLWRWIFGTAAAEFTIRDDADSAGDVVFRIDRSTNTVTTVNFPNGTLQYGGTEIGYRNLDLLSIASSQDVQASREGKAYITSAAIALTVQPQTTEAITAGAPITIINSSNTNSVTVAQGAGVTIYLAGTTTTGSRTIGPRGVCTIFRSGSDVWFASGPGVS